jgi:hypothetical protein
VIEAVHQSETLVEVLLREGDSRSDCLVVSAEVRIEGWRGLLGEKARRDEQQSGRNATNHLNSRAGNGLG